MDVLVQGAALVGMVVIGTLFVLEIRRWRSITSIIGRRQRIVRTWLILLIEALFVGMFIGPWITSRKDPVWALSYWTACTSVGLAVVVLALYDLREVMRQYARLNRNLFSDLRGDDERKL